MVFLYLVWSGCELGRDERSPCLSAPVMMMFRYRI